jgi:hypothetical protein
LDAEAAPNAARPATPGERRERAGSSPGAIFVLGADRSGTSLVAELATCWGAYPGDPSRLGAADESHPRGYFELAPMQELLRDLALELDLSLWDAAFPARVAELAGRSPWRERALGLVSEMAAPGRPWLFKEPLLGLYLGFWEGVLGTPPACIVTVRRPHDAARSFAGASFPAEIGHRLKLVTYFVLRWQVLSRAILEALERNPEHLVVAYEDLLKSPFRQVSRLCRFLDGQAGGDGEDAAAAERLAEMLEAIDPGLWHQKSERSFFDLEQVLAPQKELLRHLDRRAAGQPEPFEPARFALPPYGQEWLDNLDALRFFLAGAAPGFELSARELRRLPWRAAV